MAATSASAVPAPPFPLAFAIPPNSSVGQLLALHSSGGVSSSSSSQQGNRRSVHSGSLGNSKAASGGSGGGALLRPPPILSSAVNPQHLSASCPGRGQLGYPKSAPTPDISFEPRWINSRQYDAILRRRLWRAAHLAPAPADSEESGKESYHYLSLHKHAKKRLRSANGKFLSKAEIAKLTPAEIARLEQLMADKEREKLAAASGGAPAEPVNPPKRRRTSAAASRRGGVGAVDGDFEE